MTEEIRRARKFRSVRWAGPEGPASRSGGSIGSDPMVRPVPGSEGPTDAVKDINAFLDLLEDPIDLSLKLLATSHGKVEENISVIEVAVWSRFQEALRRSKAEISIESLVIFSVQSFHRFHLQGSHAWIEDPARPTLAEVGSRSEASGIAKAGAKLVMAVSNAKVRLHFFFMFI
ncbi:hypothetical protein NE237_011595 [Protea cynaroides]|uniref:Uncharacterized protein n=1 Tax=Protea cynaroides TaxID=273540 RepID=A0A9Q0JX76_9MAGN|nr:hypothetical protein NE237_011595 [Protea cynaroides]